MKIYIFLNIILFIKIKRCDKLLNNFKLFTTFLSTYLINKSMEFNG